MREFFGEPNRDRVQLVPYDPVWPELFQDYRRRICGVLGDGVRVDHIGSTAVPGLPAKPVIDIQVAVVDLEDEAAYRPGLESLKWPLRGRDPQRRFFRPPKGQPRVVHVHVVQAGSDYEFDHLLFRDFLCVHPQLRDAYARLKQALAAEHGGDRALYTPAKAPFIAQTLRDARAWARSTSRSRPSSIARGSVSPGTPAAPNVAFDAAKSQDPQDWDPPQEGELVPQYLGRIGEVFCCFDRQDSGCVSFGVSVAGRRWFAKTAATPEAVSSLRNAARVHAAVAHPSIIGLEQMLRVDGAPLLIYPWASGEVLYHATVPPKVTRRDPVSAIARFRALPIQEVQNALDAALRAHLAVEAAGLVAVDFYDGCLLYDFHAGVMRLCDLDEYRAGPFVLDADRLPGSTRYMAPEQHRRGALIDTRTTVFMLGRMLRLLLDAGDEETAWRGSAAQLRVIDKATRPDPDERWDSVAALAIAWRDVAGPATGRDAAP